MPKVTKKGGVYVLEPTFAEQLVQALPQMLMQMRQNQEMEEERRLRRVQLMAKYTEATPEMQLELNKDPNFVRATGARVKAGSLPLPQGYEGPLRQSLPIRDLTPDEVISRKKAAAELAHQEVSTQQMTQLVEKTRMDIEAAKRIVDAGINIDSLPTEMITMDMFVAREPGRPLSEISKLYVAKKYPGYAEEIAQALAGAGPEVQRMKEQDAFKECVKEFGTADTNCYQYAVGIASRDPDSLSKLPNLGMKSLAYQRIKADTEETAAATQRSLRAHKDAIGQMTLRIVDDDPRIPVTAAQGIATAIMEGKPLTGELMQYEANRVALKREISDTTTARLRLELEEKRSGVPELQKIISTHMAVLAQKEGIPEDVRTISSKALTKLMPELASRAAKQFGLPAGLAEVTKDGNWFTNFIWASAGFMKSTTDPFGWERRVASRAVNEGIPAVAGALREGAARLPEEAEMDPRAAMRLLRGAGHVMSKGLEVSFNAVNRLRKGYVSAVERLEGKPQDVQPKVRGNIDLSKIPVVKNADGSTSTVQGMSFGTDEGEILVPTIINGKKVSDAEAIAEYKRTGKHLGIFRTPEEATAYSKKHHAAMGPLSTDQRIHMENLAKEISLHLGDSRVPLSVKEQEAKVLDLIEEIMKGTRPFTDLIDMKVDEPPAPSNPKDPLGLF